MEMESEKARKINLADHIEYSNGSTVSKMILKKQTGNITLFAFDVDQGLSEHSAPFDAFVQIIEGKGQIIINKEEFNLETGQGIIMPANIPHAVKADQRFKMMLVMIRGN
jgi:quercetin dioxygenase-like cupin family protein